MELVDSIEEVRAALKDPDAFLKRLMEEAVGPAAVKLGIARLRPLLEPKLRALMKASEELPTATS